jgi:hypothetical protein
MILYVSQHEQILGDLIGIFLQFLGDTDESRVEVFDWKCGTKLTVCVLLRERCQAAQFITRRKGDGTSWRRIVYFSVGDSLSGFHD